MEILGILDKIQNSEKILTKLKGFETNQLCRFTQDRIIDENKSESNISDKSSIENTLNYESFTNVPNIGIEMSDKSKDLQTLNKQSVAKMILDEIPIDPDIRKQFEMSDHSSQMKFNLS